MNKLGLENRLRSTFKQFCRLLNTQLEDTIPSCLAARGVHRCTRDQLIQMIPEPSTSLQSAEALDLELFLFCNYRGILDM